MLLLKSCGIAVAVALVAFVALAPTSPPRAEAGAVDPQAVVEDLVDALNAGDAEALSALIADEFIFAHLTIGGDSFAAVGKPVFEFTIIEEVIAFNPTVVLGATEVDGNTISGAWEWSDDDTTAAGVTRIIETWTFQLNDAGLFVRADVSYDTSDAQTQQYVDYLNEQPDDEEPPPGAVIVPLAAQPGGDQPGVAVILEIGAGFTLVALEVTPGAADVPQPAHFHTGTCAAPGPIVEPLASVLDGSSFTALSTPLSELVDTGLIINVHLSEAQAAVYVSCGEVLSAAALPTPTPPTAAPTPTAAGIVAPATGAGPDAANGRLLPWALALAGGAGLLMATAAVRRMRGT